MHVRCETFCGLALIIFLRFITFVLPDLVQPTMHFNATIMTRNEEIRQAVANYKRMFPLNNINKFTFIDGAEWADKTMLDNACRWLEDNVGEYIITKQRGIEDVYIRYDIDALLRDFRKAILEK